MKKILIIIGICTLLLSMPAMTAHSTSLFEKTIDSSAQVTTFNTPPVLDYDGTFVGGLGRLYRENDEWQFDPYAYLAGVYKLGAYKKIYGYIYNLDEEQIGTIGAYIGYRIIIGFIEGIGGNRAPIIGFLFWNDETFAGRIMSVFGPAPHIIGEFRPNS